jgi:hypothetical protein
VNKHTRNSQLIFLNTPGTSVPPRPFNLTVNIQYETGNIGQVRARIPSVIHSITSASGNQRDQWQQIQQMVSPEMVKGAKADLKQYSIDHKPILWAQAHLTLSRQCVFEVAESSGPTRAADKGIEHIEEALKVLTEKNHAPGLTVAQSGLARLYPKRVAGNRTENLTKAHAAAKSALRRSKRRPFPLSFLGEMHAVMGSIYADRDFGSSDSRAANKDLAIRHYLASLQRCSIDDDDCIWAQRQVLVARIYESRKNGEPRSNAKVAIKHRVEALKVFTKSKYREDWAKTHQRLAFLYEKLINAADRAGSLTKMFEEEFNEEMSPLVEKCIESCKNALQVVSATYDAPAW